MPKRKGSDYNYKRMAKKIRKLERELKRGRDKHVDRSHSSDEHSPHPPSESSSILESDYHEQYLSDHSSKFDHCGTRSDKSLESDNDRRRRRRRRRHRAVRSVVASVPPTGDTVVEIHDIPPLDNTGPTQGPVASSLQPTVQLPTPTVPSGNNTSDAPLIEGEEPELKIVELDADLMDILGEDPTNTKEYGPEIQKDLAIRLNHIVTSGLSKEKRKELKQKYLIPSNCKLIKCPSLNPEIHASLTETQIKRDKGIEYKQALTSCALSSISSAITMLLASENKNPELLKLLMDSARIVGDIQYSDSSSRRFFILSNIKKEMKEQLEKTTIDEMLFGSNLSETIKSAKNISKSGADLRSASNTKLVTQAPTKAPAGKPLNYRPPPASRRTLTGGTSRGPRLPPPPPTQRMTTMRPTQHNSAYRMSSRQQPTRYRR